MLEMDSCKVGTESTWWEVWENGDEDGFKEQTTFQLLLESVLLNQYHLLSTVYVPGNVVGSQATMMKKDNVPAPRSLLASVRHMETRVEHFRHSAQQSQR